MGQNCAVKTVGMNRQAGPPGPRGPPLTTHTALDFTAKPTHTRAFILIRDSSGDQRVPRTLSDFKKRSHFVVGCTHHIFPDKFSL